MQIFINKNGTQLGPFPDSQVAEMLRSGQVAGIDLAWSEGMETWKPLSSFAQFQSHADGPPPIPSQAPFLPSVRRTEPLSIWSLILGIISIIGCAFGGFLAGIAAVICGHIGMSRIKQDPSLDGKGMALAGLIAGYIGLLVLPMAILAAIAIPNIAGITHDAGIASGKRNAQNLAAVSSAAVACGATREQLGTDLPTAIANLTNGISVTNNGQVMGPFKVDGLPADLSKVTNNLTFDADTGMIRYTPSNK